MPIGNLMINNVPRKIVSEGIFRQFAEGLTEKIEQLDPRGKYYVYDPFEGLKKQDQQQEDIIEVLHIAKKRRFWFSKLVATLSYVGNKGEVTGLIDIMSPYYDGAFGLGFLASETYKDLKSKGIV